MCSVKMQNQLMVSCVRLLVVYWLLDMLYTSVGTRDASSTLLLLVASLRTRTLHWFGRC